MFLVFLVLEKTLESPLDSKEIKPINLKGSQPEYSLEGLWLKLKLQYFGYLMWRTDSLEKTLMLRKIEGRKRRGQQRMRWLDGITDSVDMSLSSSGSWWWTGKPGILQSMGSQRVGHGWATLTHSFHSRRTYAPAALWHQNSLPAWPSVPTLLPSFTTVIL